VHEVGYVVKVDRSAAAPQIWVDRIAWHWCTAKELASDDPPCPSDYRITDDNPGLRRYTLSPGATVQLLDKPVKSELTHRADLDELAAYVERGRVLVDLRHTDPRTVDGIAEPFRP
jgi:hypothetical protein